MTIPTPTNTQSFTEQPSSYTTSSNDVCPHCGFCKHCGRGGYPTGNYPWPYLQPYWYSYPTSYTTYGGIGSYSCNDSGWTVSNQGIQTGAINE